MEPIASIHERVSRAVDRGRLVETARRLVSEPSPTNAARPALDALARLLEADGFTVERPAAGHPDAPAVAVRLDSGRPGRTLQFNGHLDVVHLPFVPPAVIDGATLTGSGACDMKGGTAAAVEALRALRDSGALPAGSVLLTAHDTHEAPWGFGEQLDGLVKEGYVGDAVLIPEPLCDRLPVAGRGQACWKVTIRRDGPPVHEVMRPAGEPNVLAAGADLIARLMALDAELSTQQDPVAGRSSVFVGQFHGGEIYNQYPQACWLEGTRRWIPGTDRGLVEQEFRDLLDHLASATRTQVSLTYQLVRDAFFLDAADPLVGAFQQAFQAEGGPPLATGPKPFVDDGNLFWSRARVPAITHGPKAGGQHTTNEWVSIDDLVRVARLYALTAVLYCPAAESPAP